MEKSSSETGREKKQRIAGISRIKKFFRGLEIVAFIFVVGNFLLKIFSLENVLSVFTEPIIVAGKNNISFMSFVLLFLIIYIANVISVQLKKIIRIFFAYNKNVTIQSSNAISNIVRYSSMVFFLVVGFPLIGIDISSFVVLFSALGLGVGFGLQDTIANYAAGITINLSGVIKEGDRVVIQDIEGHVQKIRSLYTLIRSVTCEELIVPNKQIINAPLQNLSHSDKHVFINTTIQVSYDTDLDFVQKILLEHCSTLPYLHHKEMYIRVSSFNDFGIDIKIIAKISDVTNKYVAVSDLNLLVWRTFKQYNVDIPFPQLDLHAKDISPNILSKNVSDTNKENKDSKNI